MARPRLLTPSLSELFSDDDLMIDFRRSQSRRHLFYPADDETQERCAKVRDLVSKGDEALHPFCDADVEPVQGIRSPQMSQSPVHAQSISPSHLRSANSSTDREDEHSRQTRPILSTPKLLFKKLASAKRRDSPLFRAMRNVRQSPRLRD